jgi:hypothetical protein
MYYNFLEKKCGVLFTLSYSLTDCVCPWPCTDPYILPVCRKLQIVKALSFLNQKYVLFS